MILAQLKKSKNPIKLGLDGILKIISGLIVLKIITNLSDDSLLANFSQLKMMSALLISVSSSLFIIGLNKLKIKYKDSIFFGGTFLTVLFISLLIVVGVLIFTDQLERIIGRATGLLLLLFVFFGFLANFLIGCKIASNENEALSNGKLYATVLSFITFLFFYKFKVDIWFSLFLYLISYYLFLTISLFEKKFFCFLKAGLGVSRVLLIDLFNIYVLTICSALVFPSCILFFRYYLSINQGWHTVSVWEAEWQLSSILLMVLSPILSITLTTFFTDKHKKSEITRLLLWKVFAFFVLFSLFFSLFIYMSQSFLISLLFNSEMLNDPSSSSLLMLLSVNFFRLISVVFFYILYVIVDTKKLIFSELLFGIIFILGLFLEVGEYSNLNMYLLLPVLVCFVYLLVLFMNTNEFRNG